MTWPKVANPYAGIEPPPGVHIPDLEELLSHICAATTTRASFQYPPGSPTCWIKYGQAVYWNEACAQIIAYNALRKLESLVRVPAVYRAFSKYPMTYIVMEYIPGKTAGKCLQESQDQSAKEAIYRSIALAFSELHRIPISMGSRPAAVSGGKILHSVFYDERATRHYENVRQLEDHINAFLKLTRKTIRVCNLTREPMVFCQSDPFPDNFMIDDNNQVVAIDFSDVSILPSSFAKYTLLDHRLGFDIRQWVYIPTTDGIDNTEALLALSGRIVMGSYSFATLGKTLPGGDEETQTNFNLACNWK